MYKAIDVSNYIIKYTNINNKPITNLKLQKMLYFIQGFYYSSTNEPFIEEDFEAWPYGPVIRNAYIEYSRFGSLLITDVESDRVNNIDFLPDDKSFLDDIISSLNKYSASELVNASHAKGSPWEKSYKDETKNIISKEVIRDYFRNTLNE